MLPQFSAHNIKSLEAWAGDLDGVFAMSDLKVLFRGQSEAALHKKVAKWLGGRNGQ